MKIIITSDNHVGFAIENEVMKNDSFDTFEEILKIGLNQKSDIFLHAGDLFNYNAQKSEYNRVTKMFDEYLFLNKNVKVTKEDGTVLNDRQPFFIIRGNHDNFYNPGCYSWIPNLDSSKYLYQLSKIENYEIKTVKPVIVEKNAVKLAIYGIEWLPTEVCKESFIKSIQFEKVDEKVEGKVFSILMTHQTRTNKDREYVPIEWWPEFFDLIINGHEHAREIYMHGKTQILVSGSTIRTFAEKEDLLEKSAYILNITKEKEGYLHNIETHNLKSLRPSLIYPYHQYSEIEIMTNLTKIAQEIKEANLPKIPVLLIQTSSTEIIRNLSEEAKKIFTGLIANPDNMFQLR